MANENAILSESMILQVHSLINGLPRQITVVPLRKKITSLQKILSLLGFARKASSLRVLQIPISTYYYEAKVKQDESELTSSIIDIFKASRNNYRTRKIKSNLKDRNLIASRRRIGRIMKQEGLVSSYTTAQFRPQKIPTTNQKLKTLLTVNSINSHIEMLL